MLQPGRLDHYRVHDNKRQKTKIKDSGLCNINRYVLIKGMKEMYE